MKFLHKFLNKEDIPWVQIIWETYYTQHIAGHKMIESFRWRSILKLLPWYKNNVICKAGKGDTILLWDDKWMPHKLQDNYLELFSFAINKDITLQQAFDIDNSEALFHRPLSVEGHQRLEVVHNITHNTQTIDQNDIWRYSWTSEIFPLWRCIDVSLAHQLHIPLV